MNDDFPVDRIINTIPIDIIREVETLGEVNPNSFRSLIMDAGQYCTYVVEG